MTIQPNVPIVNKGESYVNGLTLSFVDTTHISISSGQARDSTNINDITLSATATISVRSSAVVNGLDTGTFAANTMYAVYVIGDSTGNNASGGLISASFVAPTLPGGYDMFRRIGAIKSNATAAPNTLVLGFVQGNGRWMYYKLPIQVLNAGTNHAEYTDVDCSASVPAGFAKMLAIDMDFNANAAADVALLEAGPHVAGDIVAGFQQVEVIAPVAGAAAHTRLPVILPCGSTGFIAFQISAGALSLNLNGYQDQL